MASGSRRCKEPCCSDKGLRLETSAPYTAYGDDSVLENHCATTVKSHHSPTIWKKLRWKSRTLAHFKWNHRNYKKEVVWFLVVKLTSNGLLCCKAWLISATRFTTKKVIYSTQRQLPLFSLERVVMTVPKSLFYSWTLKDSLEPNGTSSDISLINSMQTSSLSQKHISMMLQSLVLVASPWLTMSQTNMVTTLMPHLPRNQLPRAQSSRLPSR